MGVPSIFPLLLWTSHKVEEVQRLSRICWIFALPFWFIHSHKTGWRMKTELKSLLAVSFERSVVPQINWIHLEKEISFLCQSTALRPQHCHRQEISVSAACIFMNGWIIPSSSWKVLSSQDLKVSYNGGILGLILLLMKLGQNNNSPKIIKLAIQLNLCPRSRHSSIHRSASFIHFGESVGLHFLETLHSVLNLAAQMCCAIEVPKNSKEWQ